MKWNGRPYRPPGYGIKIYPTKQDSIAELLKPLGEKTRKGNVWIPVLNQPLNVPQTTPNVSPSITPTISVSPSVTPSISVSSTPSVTPSISITPTPSTSGSVPASISYRGTNTDINDASSFTFSSVNFGTTGLVVVVIGTESAGGFSVTSVSIDGVGGTLVEAGSQNVSQRIYQAEVTNTSGDIVITCNGTVNRIAIATYTITNYISTTPQTTNEQTCISCGGMTEVTSSLAAGSVGIGALTNSSGTNFDITWTNCTERYDLHPETSMNFGGGDFTQSTSGTRSVTANMSGADGGSVLHVISWR